MGHFLCSCLSVSSSLSALLRGLSLRFCWGACAMLKLFFVLVLLSAVLGWSACRDISFTVRGNITEHSIVYGCVPSIKLAECTITSCNDPSYISKRLSIYCGNNGTQTLYGVSGQAEMTECSGMYSDGKCSGSITVCDSETESDSVKCLNSGNQWIDGSCCDEQCVCEKDGGQWVNGHCHNCNDHIPMPDKCMEVWKQGYMIDSDGNPGGGGYWAIETYECFYDSCAMSLNCSAKSSFPAGSLTCNDFLDTTSTNKCVAVIGHQCTIQCGNNVTINCNCDGSCSHASTRPDCNCPQSSSSQNNSSSSEEQNNSSSSEEQSNSSSSQSQNSSDSGPNSSNSPVDTTGNGDWEYNYSGVLNEIEYNTRQTATNTNIAAGYLSSIDRWQSTINFNIQSESNKIQGSIESGATQVANAVNGAKDSIHNTNEILSNIRGSVAGLDDSVDVPDISGWLDSASGTLESLKNPDTTFVRIDSLKSDTGTFKSKYSSMFLTGVYTRNGCYEFKMTKPQQNSKFGRSFTNDIEIDFGNLAGIFDFCAILRGICRIAGAILVLLISIKSYRSAFSSSDG